MLYIGVVGDYNAQNGTHLATTSALHEAAAAIGVTVHVDWVATDAIESVEDPALEGFDGLLIAPGSPYHSMEGALFAITCARTRGIPLLGTCGGFQHIVVEFTRNVLGVPVAEHAETSPDAPTLVITPLSCSLVGQRMDVDLVLGTAAGGAYGRLRTTERFYCNFGLNPDFRDALVAGGLVVSGTDSDAAVRVIEHPDLRFFMGTLFVPQATSTPGHAHPLLVAFVTACISAAATETRFNASNASTERGARVRGGSNEAVASSEPLATLGPSEPQSSPLSFGQFREGSSMQRRLGKIVISAISRRPGGSS